MARRATFVESLLSTSLHHLIFAVRNNRNVLLPHAHPSNNCHVALSFSQTQCALRPLTYKLRRRKLFAPAPHAKRSVHRTSQNSGPGWFPPAFAWYDKPHDFWLKSQTGLPWGSSTFPYVLRSIHNATTTRSVIVFLFSIRTSQPLPSNFPRVASLIETLATFYLRVSPTLSLPVRRSHTW